MAVVTLVQVCHGDIKSENVMVTSWNWVLITDFASFKPTYLPEVCVQCESRKSRIFSPNFIHLLNVPIYAGLQIFFLIICNFDDVMPY